MAAAPPRPTAAIPPALYKIKSSIILTRPPLLTRDLSAFETAFFLYQKRLNERLTGPFVQQVYFKDETAAALDWRIKLQERRGTAGKDVVSSSRGGAGGASRATRCWWAASWATRRPSGPRWWPTRRCA